MKTIILLHGALGISAELSLIEEQLTTKGFVVHALNFPGHGGTELPEIFSIPSFAEFVKQYIETNSLSPVTIFGYSMGGYVAVYLAKHHPQLVNKVITLATKFHWDESVAAAETKRLQPEVIEAKVPQFAFALQQKHGLNVWKDVVLKTGVMLEGLGKENALKPDDYSSIATPCLLLLGDRDKMVTLGETLSVFKQLPAAQLGILPGTPHPIEHVNAEVLSLLIKKFID